MKTFRLLFSLLILATLCPLAASAQSELWTTAKAREWYSKQPWLVGCNYIPYNAINELEMWQAETFDTTRINLELTWAESIGMNTLRVFLHDLLWQQDALGFAKRLDQFLAICKRHHIRPMLVLFDSVWDPNPVVGKQRNPKSGVHNSGWVQSPGASALMDEKQQPRLEVYVKGVVGLFANDPRVLCWDIWNEPDNMNEGNYPEPEGKQSRIEKLLPLAFEWARSAGPSQPLTSGLWKVDVGNHRYTPLELVQIGLSDIISFHNYGDSISFRKMADLLEEHGKPMICTEYLARGRHSTFETILPIGKARKIGMINWGFVAGKTQTNLPWDSWQKPYTNGREPAVWHHEIFYPDGKPYSQEEVNLIRKLTK